MKSQLKKAGILFIPLLLFFTLTGTAQITITPNFTPACSGATGAVTFTITGGTSGYTFVLANLYNQTSYPAQSSPTFNNLYAGGYEIWAYNSLDSGFLQFTLPSVVNLQTSTTSATCSQHNGDAFVTVSGGTGPYNYSWISTNFAGIGSNDSLENRPAGDYYITASDRNGCTSDTELVTILATSPDSVSVVSNGNSCSPTLHALLFYGPSPYHYLWNTGETTDSITALNSGEYIVTGTDNNGCTASDTININITSLGIDSLNIQITEPGCNTTNNGAITVHMNTGTAPYTFLWSGTSSTDSIASGLGTGQYSVTVTDSHGCTGTDSYYLYGNIVESYFSGATNPTCGASDGSLSVYAFDSYTGGGVFTYAWSNGGTGATLSNLPAGNYTVTVSDSSGCTATLSDSVAGVATFQYTIVTTPTACNTSLNTGTATAIITGGSGTPPYNFTWYNSYSGGSIIGTTQTITNLAYGTYVSVQVTDSNGCISNSSYYDTTAITYDSSCYDNIIGYVFGDTSGSCTYTAGDQGVTNAYVVVTGANGQSYYANPDSTGFYDIQVLPGIYTVSVSLYNYGSCTTSPCVVSYTDTFTTSGELSSGNNFGIIGSADFDLGVHMGCSPAAPGSQKNYWTFYYNYGTAAANNTVLSFTHDPNITLVSTNPPYTSYSSSTHTITWDLGTVTPGYTNWYTGYVEMYFDIPSTMSLGTVLYAEAMIEPITGDCNPANNTQILNDSVNGSHDPNSKEVSPAGNLSASDTLLTYTIRFQNTGNAPATLIIVKDTLSPNVNPATVIPGASSAPYKFSMSGNGVLTFTFEPINLPDSASNPMGSQGFVMYTVQTKKNLPLGSQINNTAYVYFDANPAVVTNTTTNVRSNFPNGITNIINSKITAEVVPNPVHDQAVIEFTGSTGSITLQITDELGKIITTSNVNTKVYTLNAETLAPGIYFFTAKDAIGDKAAGKISVVR